VQYPIDPQVVAICTDSAALLPEPTALPLLDVNDAQAVVDFLMGSGERFAYTAPSDD
jgi:molybdopterin-guanine dinucleotide biosynthesis protein B